MTSSLDASDTSSASGAGLILILFCFKILWIPSYFSSDFEVHRNWLAITHSLPISEWYYESSSEWTLDYPPFFAWFEYSLATIADYSGMDDGFLDIKNLNFQSSRTLLFQRSSVMLSELVYFYGAYKLADSVQAYNSRSHTSERGARKSKGIDSLQFLIVANPGILFVDHIHFQYNSIMYGMQLLSIAAFFDGSFLLGGMWFAIVLNFKHIYLYQAHAYFVYILSGYCFTGQNTLSMINLFKIGTNDTQAIAKIVGFTVISIFALSFGPFLQHLPQIISRLFPFGRGLTHAYWAPNFWALYSFTDRALAVGLKMIGKTDSGASLTRGLVGDVVFSVLPNVTPLATALLTIAFQLPILRRVWKSPSPRTFVTALILSGYSSFLFGYHVHEKAIILVLIPLSIVAFWGARYASIFFVTSAAGLFSLFPLFFTPQETPIKVLVLLIYLLVASNLLSLELSRLQYLYLIGMIPLFLYTEFVHATLFKEAMQFLPLMMMSVYTSFGTIYGFLAFYTLSLGCYSNP